MKQLKEKQDWRIIWQQMVDRQETDEDREIAEAFFRAGWHVYPESGYRFQIERNYEDGYYLHGVTKEEALRIYHAMRSILSRNFSSIEDADNSHKK